jgi:hypothetical protein
VTIWVNLDLPTSPGSKWPLLAVIPAADVAGYSRLMGADEEGHTSGLRRTSRRWSILKSPYTTAAPS